MNFNSKKYNDDGYVFYESVFSKDFIDNINNIIDNLDLTACDTVFDEDGTGKIKQIQYLWNYDEEFVKLLDKIKPLAEELTGYKTE